MDYFPEHPELQLQLEELAEEDDTLFTTHKGTVESGLNYSLKADFEYLLEPKLAMGARISLQSAADFDEQVLSGYVKYYFSPQYKQTAQEEKSTTFLLPEARF